MIVWVAAEKELKSHTATPPVSGLAPQPGSGVPTPGAPSAQNTTVPVGIPDAPETVPVILMVPPWTLGFGDEVTTAELEAFGVTAADAGDGAPVPYAFEARTVNV